MKGFNAKFFLKFSFLFYIFKNDPKRIPFKYGFRHDDPKPFELKVNTIDSLLYFI